MNIDDFWKALQPHISGGVLTLNAGDAYLQPDISALLTTHFQGALVITVGNTPAPSNNQILVTGSAPIALFGAPSTSLPVTATFAIAATGTPQLLLAVTPPTPWTLAKSFSTLANTLLGDLSFTQVSIGFASAGLPNAGIGFQGTLDMQQQPLASVAWLLNVTTTLPVSGTMTPTSAAPLIELASTANQVEVGFVKLGLFLHAASSYQPSIDAPNRQLVTVVELTASFLLGQAQHPITFSVELYEGVMSVLEIEADVSGLLLEGFSDLADFASGQSLANMIPNDLPPLSKYIVLDAIRIVANAATKTIESVTIGVGLAKDNQKPPTEALWTIIPNVVELTGIHVEVTIVFASVEETLGLFGDDALLVDDENYDGDDGLGSSLAVTSYTDTATGESTTFLVRITADVKIEDFVLEAVIDLPDVALQVYLAAGTIQPVKIVKHFFGNVDLPDGVAEIDQLGMTVIPGSKTYSLFAHINQPLPLPGIVAEVLNITDVLFYISRQQSGISFFFMGNIEILQDIPIQVTAQYATGSGWTFAGQLTPGRVIDLIALAQKYFASDVQIPDSLKLQITALAAAFNTQLKTYSFQAAFVWAFELAGIHFEVDAALSLVGTRSDPKNPIERSGSIQGNFKFNNLELTIAYIFNTQSTDVIFKYKDFTVDYSKTKDTSGKITEKITIHFGNLSFGDIILFIINLAEPGKEHKLSAPWDALNSINLQNLLLIVNLTERSIEVDYAIKLNLGFIDLDSVGLVYTRQYGQGKVNFKLTGNFLGTQYTQNNPLQWDAINGSPPAPSGQGSKLIDIRYLGLGQHVALTAQPTTMAEVIAALQKTVTPLDNPAKNPIDQLPGLKFNTSSDWLIGMDLTVIEAIAISAIFNDPNLYGVLIRLNGGKVGIFDGLSFEILYRKINDKIGVYHIELKLPDAMRHLEFGEVSITLPIVVLDIYTNGNFRIDFGFPPNLTDFSRSFSIQVFPFVGYGGFYFALLNGATSQRVPAITNGNFNPVIEFGLALSIGVGKTIQEGIFAAGASITVVGMLQGVLAWFNPNSGGNTELYYWIQGTIGIVGTIFGKVNFVVIQVDVSITASAMVTLTIESYQPILIALTAKVEVNASIKILFIRIHFHFQIGLNLSFTIGQAQPTPWQIQAGAPPTAPADQLALSAHDALRLTAVSHRLRSQRNAYRVRSNQLLRPVVRRAAAPRTAAVTATPVSITLQLAPAFTQALSDETQPSGSTQALANLLLFIENSIPSTVQAAHEVWTVAENAQAADFNLLIGELLKWVIQQVAHQESNITASELSFIHDQLADPSVVGSVFAYTNLTGDSGFFKQRAITFKVVPRPVASSDALSGAFFPFIPELAIVGQNGDQPLKNVTPISQGPGSYEELLQSFFQKLAVEYENGVENGAQPRSADDLGANDGQVEGMATYIFTNYFAMLARSVIKGAIDYLQSVTYLVADPTIPLAQIAGSFGQELVEYTFQQGDSLDYLAALFQVAAAAIQQANPGIDFSKISVGTRINIPVVVSPAAMLDANQSRADILNYGDAARSLPAATISLSNVVYQIRSGDLLEKIAATFDVGLDALISRNAAVQGLFAGGQTLQLGTLSYTARAGDTLDSVALYFSVPTSQISPQTFAPGASLTITGVAHQINAGGFVIPYVVTTGDQLDTIVTRYFPAAAQSATLLAALETAIQQRNPDVDFTQPLAVGSTLNIAYPDTLGNWMLYYGITAQQLATAIQQQGQQSPSKISLTLMPLVVLALPAIQHQLATGDTLASLAQTYNLTWSELAEDLLSMPQLFAQNAKLKIPNVPQMEIDALADALIDAGQLNNTAGMISRFLLQGLRLPGDPAHPQTQPAYPLFSLTGQAFPAAQIPTRQVGEPAQTQYYVTVQNVSQASWVTFQSNTSSQEVVLTDDEVAYISYLANPATILTLSPSTTFAARLPMTSYVPNRYTLEQHQPWQSAEQITIPGLANSSQKVGEPTLWSFPDGLINVLSSTPNSTQYYQLATSQTLSGANTPDTSALSSYFWATTVDVTVRQVPAADYGAAMLPNAYFMLGADESGKATLLDLWTYLNNAAGSDGATIYVLHRPNQAAVNARGYASEAIDRTNTFLLKTNLSTLSHNAQMLLTTFLADVPATVLPVLYAATMQPDADATTHESRDFIQMLWECSVVRSGGFYLNYVNSDGGTGLPDYLFADSSETTLTLLIVLASQSSGTTPAIYPFNNCAVVSTNIDTAHVSVIAQPYTYQIASGNTLQYVVDHVPIPQLNVAQLAATNQSLVNLLRPQASMIIQGQPNYQIQPGDSFASISAAKNVPVATLAGDNANQDLLEPGALLQFLPGQLNLYSKVPQGNVGFQFQRPNPDPGSSQLNSDDTTQTLDGLYSMLGFHLLDNTYFQASDPGLPVGPTYDSSDPTTLGSASEDDSTWFYKHLVSIYQFAQAPYNQAIDCAALPARANNPYAGIFRQSPSSDLSSVALQLDLRDVYGNHTKVAPPFDTIQLAIPVGYFDTLTPLSQYPSLTSSYWFDLLDNTPALYVDLGFKIMKVMPSPGNSLTTSQNTARVQAQAYSGIYYQLIQPDVSARLSTSLGSLAIAGPIPADTAMHLLLSNFVSSIYIFLSTMQTMQPFLWTGDGTTTLATLAQTYQLTPAQFVDGSQTLDLTHLFGTGAQLTIPQYYVFVYGNSLNDVLPHITVSAACNAPAGATSDQQQLACFFAYNGQVALRAGTAVQRTTPAQPKTADQALTLLALANAYFTTVIDLAGANTTVVLGHQLTLTYQGLSATTGDQDTLTSMVAAFKVLNPNLDISEQSLALANQLIPALFADVTQLKITSYTLQAGNTLDNLPQPVTGDDMIAFLTANQSVTNLYDNSTSLYVSASSYAVQPLDTFASVAAQERITVGQLAGGNGGLVFQSGASVPIPYLALLSQVRYSSYLATGDESWQTLSQSTGWDLTALTELNQNVPAIFNPSVDVKAVGTSVTPKLTDTLNTLAQHFGLKLPDFVAQIQTQQVIRPGALIVGLAMTVKEGETLKAVAQRYNVEPEHLAEANSAVRTSPTTNLLQTGQSISYAGQTVPVVANDTFVTLTAKINQRLSGTIATVYDIAHANPDLKLNANVVLVAPPINARLVATVTPSFPDLIFPVEVNLTLNRDPNWVDPDFSHTPAVATSTVAITAAPLASEQDQEAGDAVMSLQVFAQQFEAAFGNRLKLGTGQMRSAQTNEQRLWAVHFQKGSGIYYNVLGEQVHFFAVKPLTTQLWSYPNVTIRDYDPQTGQLSASGTNKNFQNQDPDAWFAAFLTSVDLMLTPDYSVPLYELSPGNYDALVAVKQQIAEFLQSRVDYVLEDPHADASYLTQAQEALYQQALVQLMSAYQTDVLVQYPFDIQIDTAADRSGYFASADTAPRLSGKPVALFYQIQAGETFQTLAAHYAINPDYLAQVFQNIQQILNVGVEVGYGDNGQTYTIAATDTLASIAQFFGVAVTTLPEQLTIVTTGASLFKAQAVLNVTGVTYVVPQPASGTVNTITNLAGYFGVTVNEFFLANRGTQGLFGAQTIKLGSVSAAVESSDDLAAIAQKFNQSLDALATLFWQYDLQRNPPGAYGYTLSVGATAYGLQRIPSYSISTGKFPLYPNAGIVTFLFNVEDVAQQKMLFLNLDYVINELEYDIHAVNNIQGYQESSWLTFIIPINAASQASAITLAGAASIDSSSEIGQVQVVLPLREYPSNPILSAQSGTPTDPQTGDLSKISDWTYSLQVQQQTAAQDQIYLEVLFNSVAQENFQLSRRYTADGFDSDQLFKDLAQFNAVYPQLRNTLLLLLSADGIAQNKALLMAAVQTYVDLVDTIVGTWQAQPSTAEIGSDPIIKVETFIYTLDTIVDTANPGNYAFLSMSADENNPRALWADITDIETGQPLKIVDSGSQNTAQIIYQYEHKIAEPIDLRFAFKDLDVILEQNGWSGISTTRNNNLTTVAPVNQAFVYQTPLSMFPNRITPLVINNACIQISATLDLPLTLQDFFQTVFHTATVQWQPTDTMRIKLACRYGYTLVTAPHQSAASASICDSTDAIWSYIPILFHPNYDFKLQTDWNAGDPDSFVSQTSAIITDRAAQIGIQAAQGYFVFDISIYSTLQNQSSQPILQLTQILSNTNSAATD